MPTTTVNTPIHTQFNTGSDVIWTIDGPSTAHVDLAGPSIVQITSYVLQFRTTFTPVIGASLSINSAAYSLTMRNNGSGITSVSILATNGTPTACTGGTQVTLSDQPVIGVIGDTATLVVDVRVTGDSFYSTSTTTVGTAYVVVGYTVSSLFNGQMLINF